MPRVIVGNPYEWKIFEWDNKHQTKNKNYYGNYCTVEKNYGTMEKLWYYNENYGTITKTIELWFTMGKKLWYYLKTYCTIVHYG